MSAHRTAADGSSTASAPADRVPELVIGWLRSGEQRADRGRRGRPRRSGLDALIVHAT